MCTEKENLEQELAKIDIQDHLDSLDRSITRLRKLVQLNAPKEIVYNESRIIQYRLISVLQAYDCRDIRAKVKS